MSKTDSELTRSTVSTAVQRLHFMINRLPTLFRPGLCLFCDEVLFALEMSETVLPRRTLRVSLPDMNYASNEARVVGVVMVLESKSAPERESRASTTSDLRNREEILPRPSREDSSIPVVLKLNGREEDPGRSRVAESRGSSIFERTRRLTESILSHPTGSFDIVAVA